MLEDNFGAIFIWEHPQDGIIGLMLHHHIFILNVIEFEFESVIQHDEEIFVHEILAYLFLGFKREHLWLGASLAWFNFKK